MKTKLLITGLAAIAIAACGKKDTTLNTSANAEPPAPATDFVLLVTDLPSEQLVSTPVPVRIPGVNPQAIRPGEVRTPGIARVIYRKND